MTSKALEALRHAAPKAMSAGATCGAVGGAVLALNDFGATWLWQATWPDRGWLLLHLVASLVPAGAVAGALAGVVLAATAAWAGKRPRAWALSAGVAAVPLAAYLAMHLFSGGSASKLANRGLYEFVAGVLVAAGASVAAVIGLRIATLPSRAGLRAVAALALGGSFALSKIDQWVLPNLYIYLHSLLTVAAWALAAGSVALLSLGFPEARSLKPPGIRVGGAVLLAATALFVAHLASLPHHANARVALVDARASNSQSLMRALEPLFRSGKEDEATRRAAAEARAAREERQAVLARGADLPTWEGAHVLLITVDALRADHIGNYGYARPTSPNLDAFAKTSVVFERAYAQAPHSSYSLSSLMTSEYLHDTLDLGRPPPTETLATALASAGYHTATFFPLGIFHTEGERLKRYRDNAFGFDRHDHRDLAAEPLTDAALAEADRVVADGEPPSFTWVHYFDVHEPYRATHFGTDNMARYDSEILHADKEIRRLIDGFDQRMQRDVVVVISADHGEEFREHGGVYHGSSLYEEQVRIPLLIRAPDLPPRRIGGQVEAVDIAPTILGMTHAKIPASMRGDDLRAVMLGRLPDMGPAFSSVLKMRMGVRWPLKIIADLRFGFFELYDLEKDPGERTNLARADSKDLGVLKGEVYAWLDGLSRAPRRGGDASSSEGDPLLAAIAQGRLWDRRSVTPLSKAVADESVDPSIRREAARILGLLADPMATTALLGALRSKNALVSAEAAIALGRLENPKAHAALRRLAYAEDPDIRARAAVSLARMRDPASVPGLIDALWVTTTTYDREEAVRWLGRMRDERGVEPLIDLIPESRLRHLTVVALGMIGDMRAYQLLVDMLSWESRTDVRDQVVRAFGYMHATEAIPIVLDASRLEPALRNAPETLVRLGAIDVGIIAGTDVRRGGAGLQGFGACHEEDPYHDWNYREQTWCESTGDTVHLKFNVPPAVAANGPATVLLRLRRTDAEAAVPVTVKLGRTTTDLAVDRQFLDARWSQALAAGPVDVTIRTTTPGARLGVDHLLVYPNANSPQLAPPGASTTPDGTR